MGDCNPGPGCHDRDGIHILQGLGVALPITCLFAAAVWFAAAMLRAILSRFLPQSVLNVILFSVTLAVIWFGFDPAFRLFFWWTAVE